jgi:hypothetical protein
MTYALGTAKEAFDLILSVGAGTGLLYLLRWFWWRVSAWSEIAAMVSSFVVALGFFVARKMGHDVPTDASLLITVATTTIVWVATAFVGPAEDRETLVRFFSLVRPSGPGWKPIAAEAGLTAATDGIARALLGWAMGCAFVYAALFGTGSFLYGHLPQFFAWLTVFVLSGAGVAWVLRGFWKAER